jgi:hypothetical protein
MTDTPPDSLPQDPTADLPGVPNGTTVTSPDGNTERIMLNVDDQGNVLGWYKEAVDG